jgi:hypothetical protein
MPKLAIAVHGGVAYNYKINSSLRRQVLRYRLKMASKIVA